MHDTTLLVTPMLAEAFILMSIAKPLLLVALLVPYMRFVAQFEMDARRFNLPVLQLNFLFIGVAALAVGLIAMRSEPAAPQAPTVEP